jgi:HEPN superfamily Apea-like protein/ApeA-like protein
MAVLADLTRGTKQFANVHLSDGQDAQAEFVLSGPETYVELFAKTLLDNRLGAFENVWASMIDGTMLSFLRNAQASQSVRPGAIRPYHLVLQPLFVFLGRRHVVTSDKIKRFDFLIDDASTIFAEPNTFGYALRPEQHINAIIDSNRAITSQTAQVGEKPVIGYFGGKPLIFEATTDIGKISALHVVSHGSFAANTVHIEGPVHIHLDLTEPCTLPAAVDDLLTALRFLDIVAGRPQNLLALSAVVNHEEEEHPFEVYWRMPPRRWDGIGQSRFIDVPLSARLDPSRFALVIGNWISKDPQRRDARERFSGCFAKQSVYDIDRLIGAANMFDILPADAAPEPVSLSEELSDAKNKGQQLFRPLSPSPERDSILSALGRLGQNTLKRKIRHRASIVLKEAPDRFPDLDTVVDEAVNCRNHYVHGSKAKIDYARHFADVVPFLTNTLEFIFAASEFVEAGWNLNDWHGYGAFSSHPWIAYAGTYVHELSVLQTLLRGETLPDTPGRPGRDLPRIRAVRRILR